MKKRIASTLLLIIVIILSGLLLYLLITKDVKELAPVKSNDEVITAGIYQLVSNPTKYQVQLFKELQTILEDEEYEEQSLAEILAKNFIVEFYTLSNVDSREVRGLQFVALELRERFNEFGYNIYNYYQYYENKKELEVNEISIKSCKAIKYNYNDELKEISAKKDLPGFELLIEWSYKNQTKTTTKVVIVKWDDNYSIIKVEN